MRLRPYEPADYLAVSPWWRAREHAVVPEDALPNLGIVCERDDETPLAAGFCYLSGTAFAYLAWLVTSPDASPREAHEALTLVSLGLEQMAERAGVRHVFATSGVPGLTKLLRRNGWTADARPHILLTKEI